MVTQQRSNRLAGILCLAAVAGAAGITSTACSNSTPAPRTWTAHYHCHLETWPVYTATTRASSQYAADPQLTAQGEPICGINAVRLGTIVEAQEATQADEATAAKADQQNQTAQGGRRD